MSKDKTPTALPEKPGKDEVEFEPVKITLEQWDFDADKEFSGVFTGNRQVLQGAGVKDENGKPGDIELLHFVENVSGENYGLINSGVLQTITFEPGRLYRIISRGQGSSKKTGRNINLFDVYVAKKQ